jgi:transposase
MSATPNGWPPWRVPGLLRGSFVPPAKLRELRVISRQRQKLVSLLTAEKNRMHKVLTDAGIRLGVVVSDIHGQSARAMIKGILDGQAPHEVLNLASRRLKASREELHDALQGELTASHVFVLDELLRHIEELEARIARFDARLLVSWRASTMHWPAANLAGCRRHRRGHAAGRNR